MRFLIVGTGGVGGYFGAKLEKAGIDVHFLARGKHYEAMMEHGLRVKSDGEEFTVLPDKIISDPEEAGTVDVVLFCVKSYDTLTAAAQLKPVLHEGGTVISFQNGVDNEEKIASVLPGISVLGGAAYISSTITAPGEITRLGQSQKLVFGPLDGKITEAHEEIFAVMKRGTFDTVLSADIQTELWKKLIFLAPAAGFTTITRLPIGESIAGEESRTLMRESMLEIQAVGRACGVNIPTEFIDSQMNMMPTIFSKIRSSMYFDLINGKRLEIDSLSGTIVRLGEQHGIPTPVHRFMYAMLLPHHLIAMKKAGL